MATRTTPEYEYRVFDKITETLTMREQLDLHASLRELGCQCLTPLPNYQVFVKDVSAALRDKIVVTALYNNEHVAFVSAVSLQISDEKISRPVIHSGLTVIHPDHRRTKGVIQQLFANLFLHLLQTHPEGVWMTTVADVVSSLVHMSKYLIHVFPCPPANTSTTAATKTTGSSSPCTATTTTTANDNNGNNNNNNYNTAKEIHRLIAKEFDQHHHDVALITHSARFDPVSFVYYKSRPVHQRDGGDDDGTAGFLRDFRDARHQHRDGSNASAFYRRSLI